MEYKEISLQHVQLPNDMLKSKRLAPNDLWVYVCIKSYLNGKNGDCFPSLRTLSEKSDFSVPTIRDSIKLLQEEGWITIEKIGRMQKYHFKSYKNFEVFSYDFIQKKDIEPKEKAYILATQQYMFKDTKGYGKLSYSDKELADKINLSPARIGKLNDGLIEKGYLSLLRSDVRNGIAFGENKIYHLDELGQAVVFAIQKHDQKLDDLESRMKEIEMMANNPDWVMKRLILAEKKLYEKDHNEISEIQL